MGTYKELQKAYPDWQVVDEEEEYRLEMLKMYALLGKGFAGTWADSFLVSRHEERVRPRRRGRPKVCNVARFGGSILTPFHRIEEVQEQETCGGESSFGSNIKRPNVANEEMCIRYGVFVKYSAFGGDARSKPNSKRWLPRMEISFFHGWTMGLVC